MCAKIQKKPKWNKKDGEILQNKRLCAAKVLVVMPELLFFS